ncbi:AMP-binding protein, partial [Bacillus sp. ISL-26]|uniref:condensation domain-containing protein n=1 Tax=Bacillus sp. ISL-26 TaxID=2819119 RepID=UPI001BEC3E7B
MLNEEGADFMLFRGSSFQKKVWLDDEKERGDLYTGGPSYYNIPLIFRIEGELSVSILNKTINSLIQKHEVLRTKLLKKDGEVMQSVEDEVDFTIRHEDWSNNHKTSEEAIDFLKEINNKAFADKLSERLLCQGFYLKLSESCSYFLFTIHNSHCDEVSKGTLRNDIINFYKGHENTSNFQYTELPLQYADFSEWQNELPDEVLEGEILYWKRKLQSDLQPLNLPTDFIRRQNGKYAAGEYTISLRKELVNLLDKTCLQYGYDPRDFFMAVLQIFLSTYLKESEVTFGTYISKRMNDLEETVGPIANVALLKDSLTSNSMFIEVVEKVKNTYTEAEAHSKIPLERLILELNLNHNLDKYDICRFLFNYTRAKKPTSDTEFNEIKLNLGLGKYDYNLLVEETGSKINLYLTYNKYIYSSSSAEQLVHSFITLFEELVLSPEQKIHNINLTNSMEKEKILNKFNNTALSNSLDKNIVTRFEDQVSQTPDKVAVCAEGKEITYQELNAKANELAVQLRQMGIGRDDYVAIMAERNIETIIGICGIVKAGGAYVPVDPAYPLERVAYMLEDCKPKAILVNGSSYAYKGDIPIVDVSEAMQWTGRQENPVNINTVNDLIYLIYTSGTTGKPKGVMVEHKSVTRLVHRPNYVELNKDTVILQTGSLSFDAATFEIWGA